MVTAPKEDLTTRVGMSLAYALNCPEMVVNSLEEYEDFAVRMALGDKGTNEELL